MTITLLLILLFPLFVLLVLSVLLLGALIVVIWVLKRRALLKPALLWASVATLMVVTALYFGYCTGVWGKPGGVLNYVFQCACSRSLENIRVRKLYSEHAEIMFSACDEVGPIPSPSGQKVAVIDYEHPDESYVWFLQADERMPFIWPGNGDLIWLSDDLLLVRWGPDMHVVDPNTGVEYPLPVRTDIRLDNGEIAPSVLSALQEARYVINTGGELAAISPDALASPEHSFVTPYDELGYERYYVESFERMEQFLHDQNIDYLDYIHRNGTDILYGPPRQDPYVDLVSPDRRFFFRAYASPPYENGLYLVETGEKIANFSGYSAFPIGWVDDGVLFKPFKEDFLFYFLYDITGIRLCQVQRPWLKLRVPAEYSGAD